MKITLTNERKLELQIQHSTTRDGRVRDRIKAVIHASNGWSSEEIADALLIHESTVRQHIKDYLQSNKLNLKMVAVKANSLLLKPCTSL